MNMKHLALITLLFFPALYPTRSLCQNPPVLYHMGDEPPSSASYRVYFKAHSVSGVPGIAGIKGALRARVAPEGYTTSPTLSRLLHRNGQIFLNGSQWTSMAQFFSPNFSNGPLSNSIVHPDHVPPLQVPGGQYMFLTTLKGHYDHYVAGYLYRKNGKPYPGVTVSIPSYPDKVSYTDHEGRFVLHVDSRSSATVKFGVPVAGASNENTISFDLSYASVENVEARSANLPGYYSLSGKTDRADALVTIRYPVIDAIPPYDTVRTDAYGQYVFDNIAPGDYKLFVDGIPGFTLVHVNSPQSVAPDIVGPAQSGTGFISKQIIDPDGNPIPSVSLAYRCHSYTSEHVYEPAVAMSNRDGYVLASLPSLPTTGLACGLEPFSDHRGFIFESSRGVSSPLMATPISWQLSGSVRSCKRSYQYMLIAQRKNKPGHENVRVMNNDILTPKSSKFRFQFVAGDYNLSLINPNGEPVTSQVVTVTSTNLDNVVISDGSCTKNLTATKSLQPEDG